MPDLAKFDQEGNHGKLFLSISKNGNLLLNGNLRPSQRDNQRRSQLRSLIEIDFLVQLEKKLGELEKVKRKSSFD